MSIYTVREYFDPARKACNSVFDYGEYLEDLNRYSQFMDHWGHMLFILDVVTRGYPFLNKGTTNTMGSHREAFKEGGIEFTIDRLEVSEEIQKECFKEQFRIFSEYPDIPGEHFQVKVMNPFRDNKGQTRSILQHHRIAYKDATGLPLGYYGSCTWINNGAANIKISQEILIFNPAENWWMPVSYLEFSPWIDPDKLLSTREIEILKYIADGWGSKQIAGKLCLSLHTVHTHRKNMLRRTNSVNTAELIAYALKHGLI